MPASSACTSSTPSAAHSAAISQLLGLAAEPDEAARGAEGGARLLDGHPDDRVEVELRAHLARDRRQQPLALEGVLERRRRTGPLQGERRLGRDRSQRAELLGGERAMLVGRGDREHGDHALAGDQRDEGRAAGADPPGDSLVDERRGVRVVDRHGRGLERRARHARRLVPQVEADVAPRVEVHAVPAGEQAAALAELVVDEDETDELHREQGGDLVQDDPRDRFGVSRAGERVGDRLNRLELALAERRPLLGSAATPKEPVESGGATIRLHWAFVMIGPRAAVRRGRFLTYKDGSYGLLAGRRPQITVVAHWAMRTAA